mgnify:CR=1 FL=1
MTQSAQNRQEDFFHVSGMHCSNCERFLENEAAKISGVHYAEASYAADMVRLKYDPAQVTKDQINEVFTRTGYELKSDDSDNRREEDDKNTVARLIIGGLFTMMAMTYYILFLYPTYFGSSGFMDLNASEGYFALANIFVMASFVLFYTGYPILRGGYVSLKVRTPNMDLLVALAAAGAYTYSIGALLAGFTDVYFDVTMTLVMVVSVGNWYENKIKKRASSQLRELTREQVETARRIDDDKARMVPVGELDAGDRLLVRPGERIPIDGTIVDGRASIDESLISGESLPVIKSRGDRIIGGALVTDHALTIEVGPEAENTLDRLVHLIWDIQTSRPGAQKLADRLARFFVPAVLVLSGGTFLIGLLVGWTFTNALLTALTVLIVSCPCALGLATPLALAAGIREALKNQIVIKNASVFEEAPELDYIVFDKTGTLTTGEMRLIKADVNQEVLYRARAVEEYASHPVARAIAAGELPSNYKVDQVENHLRGIQARVNNDSTFVGEPEWVANFGFNYPEQWRKMATEAYQEGHIPVAVAWRSQIRGILIVGDRPRHEQKALLEQLKNTGKELVMLTGDSERATLPFKRDGLLQKIYSRVKPEEKEGYIAELKKNGKVAMIGDGSNDAPALARADIGIAFGPTALAADSADLVILDNDLSRVPMAFQIARLTNQRIKQNLGWAFLYNIIAIPLAAAGMINPLFAALAMASSSLLVVINSSRSMKF